MNTGRTQEEKQLFVIRKVCEYHYEKLAKTGRLFLGFQLSFEVQGTQNMAALRIEGSRKGLAEDLIIMVSVHRKDSDVAISHYMPGRRTKEETLAWLHSEAAVQEIFQSMKELSAAVDERA